MAYYLDWGLTSSKRVELSSEISLPADFEMEMSVVNLANSSFILSGGSSSGGFEIYRNGSGRLQIYISGSSVFNGSIPLSNDKESPQVLRISRDTSNNITVFIGGQQDGVSFVSSGTLKIKTVGQRPGGSWFNNSNMALYSLSVSKSQVLTNRYIKQDLNDSNDTVFTDTTGGNNGTLVNFPTDNSQWIFYDDGGGSEVTSDVAFSVNAPSVSVSTSATLPQPFADISYSVSLPTVAASIDASLPQPLSDVAFTVNSPSVAASANATIPGYNASVSFTVNLPSVSADASATLPNPSADVDYTVNTPSISADTAASLPQPDSGIAFTVSTPSVSATASATQTDWNADVSFTVNSPSVSISASATLPLPDSVVSFAVSPPQVSVVAIVGGIAIIVDDETNINQRVMSNNINAPILSNNING